MKNKLFLALISVILIFSTLCFFACGGEKRANKSSVDVKTTRTLQDEKGDNCPDCKRIDDRVKRHRHNRKRRVKHHCPDCEHEQSNDNY